MCDQLGRFLVDDASRLHVLLTGARIRFHALQLTEARILFQNAINLMQTVIQNIHSDREQQAMDSASTSNYFELVLQEAIAGNCAESRAALAQATTSLQRLPQAEQMTPSAQTLVC